MTQPAKHAGVTSCPRAAAPAHLTQEDSFMGRNTTQVKIKARSAKQKEINLFKRRCEADTALLAGQGWRLDLQGRLQEAEECESPRSTHTLVCCSQAGTQPQISSEDK